MADVLLPMVESSQAFLFNEHSKSEYSPVFSVPLGGGVLLRAFGLSKKEREGSAPAKPVHASVHMVRSTTMDMPSGTSNCSGETFVYPDYDIVYESCVAQCGHWSLHHKQNIAVLVTPGAYRLVLNDAASVGSVVIEAIRIGRDNLQYIPEDLFFGSVTR